MKPVLILQGPNLNLLGQREPWIYGDSSLADLHTELERWVQDRGFELEFLQSNHEGELIDAIQGAGGRCLGVVINPGGFSHSSVALRDAIAAAPLPVVEVHLSNLHARESWRQSSLTGAVARGVIGGFGAAGYKLAILYLVEAV